MVTSGLSERTEVAQQRLALHLMIAAATFGALIYAAAGLGERPRPGAAAGRGLVISARLFAAAVFCQLGLGALVAGLRAGLIYNTWPLMGSSFIPGEAFKPGWLQAILNDPATSQFDHRLLAYAIVAFAVLQAVAASRAAPLLSLAPIELALAHQALALALFGLAIVHLRATEMEQGR